VRLRFLQDLGNLSNTHIFGVFEPKRCELAGGQKPSGLVPNAHSILGLQQLPAGVIGVRQFRNRSISYRLGRAVMVDALVSGDGEQPGGKGAMRTETVDCLKGSHKGVLRQFGRIAWVLTKLNHKRIDPAMVAKDQFVKRRQGPGLGLAGQILVGKDLPFVFHSRRNLINRRHRH